MISSHTVTNEIHSNAYEIAKNIQLSPQKLHSQAKLETESNEWQRADMAECPICKVLIYRAYLKEHMINIHNQEYKRGYKVIKIGYTPKKITKTKQKKTQSIICAICKCSVAVNKFSKHSDACLLKISNRDATNESDKKVVNNNVLSNKKLKLKKNYLPEFSYVKCDKCNSLFSLVTLEEHYVSCKGLSSKTKKLPVEPVVNNRKLD